MALKLKDLANTKLSIEIDEKVEHAATKVEGRLFGILGTMALLVASVRKHLIENAGLTPVEATDGLKAAFDDGIKNYDIFNGITIDVTPPELRGNRDTKTDDPWE